MYMWDHSGSLVSREFASHSVRQVMFQYWGAESVAGDDPCDRTELLQMLV